MVVIALACYKNAEWIGGGAQFPGVHSCRIADHKRSFTLNCWEWDDCWLRLSALHITLLPSFSHDGKEKNERVIVSLCNFRVDMMPSWDVFILDVALSSARREVLVIVHVLCSPKMTALSGRIPALSSHSLSLSRHSVSSNLRAI